MPATPDPDYRRRDLNVVPIIDNGRKRFVAFSGVWTVPIELDRAGVPSMADPDDPGTFKQAMNNYASATLGFYSSKTRSSYTVSMGGISYGFFAMGAPQGREGDAPKRRLRVRLPRRSALVGPGAVAAAGARPAERPGMDRPTPRPSPFAA